MHLNAKAVLILLCAAVIFCVVPAHLWASSDLAALESIIENKHNRMTDPGKVRAAMAELGELGKVEGARVLLDNITYPEYISGLTPKEQEQVMFPLSENSGDYGVSPDGKWWLTSNRFPAVQALVRIGPDVIPLVLDRLAKADSKVNMNAYLDVLIEMMDSKEVEALLDKEFKDRQSTKEQAHLRQLKNILPGLRPMMDIKHKKASPDGTLTDEAQKTVVFITDLQIEKGPYNKDNIQIIPFDDNHDLASVALPNGKHKVIQTELKSTSYKFTLVEKTGEETITKPGRGGLSCFELLSKDKTIPYHWYLWLTSPAGRFKLFITPDGNTYLTWVEYSSVCFTEVSKPMDESRKMIMISDPVNNNKTDIQCVNVIGVVPQPPGEALFVDSDTSALYISIYVTSLEKDGKSGFRLQLHGADASRTYTLVTDKEAKYGWWLKE